MLIVALLFIGVIGLPTLLTIWLERSHRPAWGIVTDAYERVGDGAYRGVQVARRSVGRAPDSVVGAAWSAFFLGQMILPGVLALLLLLLVLAELPLWDSPTLLVSALSAPSGLWLGGRQLAVGRALLTRSLGAASLSRRTALWAIVHNVVLIGAMSIAALLGRDDNATAFALVTVACALLAIGQAGLLRRAARDLERHAVREWLPEAEPASV